MPAEAKQKVLYIAGSGRSGSTLIDVVLGQVPGFFPVGEVRNVWDYGLVENRPCGCGKPVRDCPTWGDILGDEITGQSRVEPRQVARWRECFAQTKHLLPIFLKRERYAHHPTSGIRDYSTVVENLYRRIAHVTGARVIVDSSKWPTYAFLLSSLPSIDLYILHLVRDPRACAFSWLRQKQTEPGVFLDVQGPVYTTSYWLVWNPAIRYLFARRPARYMFLRYEDFAAHPRPWLDQILRFVGEGDAPSPFVEPDLVSLSPTHTVEGNATRFTHGPLRIREDTEWRKKMPWRSKAVVTAMTWPLLCRYGFWPPLAERRKSSSHLS